MVSEVGTLHSEVVTAPSGAQDTRILSWQIVLPRSKRSIIRRLIIAIVIAAIAHIRILSVFDCSSYYYLEMRNNGLLFCTIKTC